MEGNAEMGIDGNNTVRLIRKKSAKAVKEFKELANYLNEVFAVLEDGGTRFVIGYDAVEVELDVRDDRDFFFNRCIAETVLQMKPVKCREDLKFIPDGDSDWGGRLVSICKKYDCWLESSSWHDSNVEAHQYYLMDNNGNDIVEAELGMDETSAEKIAEWKGAHEKARAALKEFFGAEIDVASSEVMIGADDAFVAETSKSNSETGDKENDDMPVDELPF